MGADYGQWMIPGTSTWLSWTLNWRDSNWPFMPQCYIYKLTNTLCMCVRTCALESQILWLAKWVYALGQLTRCWSGVSWEHLWTSSQLQTALVISDHNFSRLMLWVSLLDVHYLVWFNEKGNYWYMLPWWISQTMAKWTSTTYFTRAFDCLHL